MYCYRIAGTNNVEIAAKHTDILLLKEDTDFHVLVKTGQ